MNPLFHYTKFESLKGMLGGIIRQDTDMCMTVRASSAYCMDDQTEMNYGFPFIKLVIEDLSKQGVINNEKGLIDLFNKTVVPVSKPDRNYFIPAERTPFIISFTHKYNNDRFWEEYGNHGYGICLIFDGDMLSDVAKQKTDAFLLDVAYLYNKPDYEVWSPLLQVIVMKIAELQFYSPLLKNEDVNKFQQAILERFCPVISALIKDGDIFAWENEVRWISICNGKTAKVNDLSKNYIDIRIPINCLKEIISGPKFDKQEELSLICNKYNLELKNQM